MDSNTFLHILSDAQQEHEGWSETTGAAYPNLNPGNLKFVGQANAVASSNGFCKFNNFYDGKQAQLNDLTAKYNAGLHTLRAIITRYAPPKDNDTDAYIATVVAFFKARNIVIDADEDIPTFINNFQKPVVLTVIDQMYDPPAWAAIQAAIVQNCAWMPNYTFSCRYSSASLVGHIISLQNQMPPGGQYSGPDGESVKQIIAPYNHGELMNIVLYSGTLLVGFPMPFGGCEYGGVKLDPVSSVASAMFEGPSFVDSFARVIFHELIHELFDITQQGDSLHAYLIAHGGYAQNTEADLLAVFNGSSLNTPAAVATLEKDEKSL
jgi:hypothetical protein